MTLNFFLEPKTKAHISQPTKKARKNIRFVVCLTSDLRGNSGFVKPGPFFLQLGDEKMHYYVLITYRGLKVCRVFFV